MTNKVWNFVGVAIMLTLGFHVLGIEIPGQTDLFSFTGVEGNSTTGEVGTFDSFTISAKEFFTNLFSTTAGQLGILFALLAAGGAIISGLAGGRFNVENIILLPFITGTLVFFVATFVSIISYAISTQQTWVASILSLFLIPYTALFIIALAEWFRGTD